MYDYDTPDFPFDRDERGQGRGPHHRPPHPPHPPRPGDIPGFPFDDPRIARLRDFGPAAFREGGPGRRGPRSERGPRSGRASRGDIRGAILALISEAPMHGYQLIQEISTRSGGRWQPSPGAIYPALNMLEDEGLITIVADSGRKLATLTEQGTAYVEAHKDTLSAIWQDAAERGGHPARALRDAIGELGAASMQVARSGTDAQIKQAQDVLEKARRELYLILAGDPSNPETDSSDTGSESPS